MEDKNKQTKPLYKESVEVKIIHFILATVSQLLAVAIHNNYFRVADWSVPGSFPCYIMFFFCCSDVPSLREVDPFPSRSSFEV